MEDASIQSVTGTGAAAKTPVNLRLQSEMWTTWMRQLSPDNDSEKQPSGGVLL